MFFNRTLVNHYITLLNRLGIAKNQITYCLHFGSNQKPKPLKTYWLNALDVNHHAKILNCAQENSIIGPKGNLAIGIKFNDKSKASDALRYALAMLWIYNEGVLKKAPDILKSAA